MLDQLRSIVQEVNSARDLQSALDIIVTRVRSALSTQVCSVYLLDKDINSHVLMASQGLKAEAVGRVSLQTDEGLVGLVAKYAEPINLSDASTHPSYFYLQDTGEEEFNSFLGVPIIHHRAVLGVLVIQQRESRRFDEGEEAAWEASRKAQVDKFMAEQQLARERKLLEYDERRASRDNS